MAVVVAGAHTTETAVVGILPAQAIWNVVAVTWLAFRAARAGARTNRLAAARTNYLLMPATTPFPFPSVPQTQYS